MTTNRERSQRRTATDSYIQTFGNFLYTCSLVEAQIVDQLDVVQNCFPRALASLEFRGKNMTGIANEASMAANELSACGLKNYLESVANALFVISTYRDKAFHARTEATLDPQVHHSFWSHRVKANASSDVLFVSETLLQSQTIEAQTLFYALLPLFEELFEPASAEIFEIEVWRSAPHCAGCYLGSKTFKNIIAHVPLLNDPDQSAPVNVYQCQCGAMFALETTIRAIEDKYGLLLFERLQPSNGSGTSSSYSMYAPDSIFSRYGYSVSKQAGLSDGQRQQILHMLIATGKASRADVESHLGWLISTRGHRLTDAAERWQQDLLYINKSSDAQLAAYPARLTPRRPIKPGPRNAPNPQRQTGTIQTIRPRASGYCPACLIQLPATGVCDNCEAA